jgi:hypothetical protein
VLDLTDNVIEEGEQNIDGEPAAPWLRRGLTVAVVRGLGVSGAVDADNAKSEVALAKIEACKSAFYPKPNGRRRASAIVRWPWMAVGSR